MDGTTAGDPAFHENPRQHKVSSSPDTQQLMSTAASHPGTSGGRPYAAPVTVAAAPAGQAKGQAVTQMYSSSYSTATRQEQSHRHEVYHTSTVHAAAATQQQPLRSPPAPPSAKGPSRFNFKCDTRAPSELKRLQDDAFRRREEFKNRVAETERRIASWTARLANEAVDRDLAYDALTERALSIPLEAAMGRVVDRLEGRLARPALSGEDAGSSDSNGGGGEGTSVEEEKKAGTAAPPPLPELERRVADLDSALLRHAHRTTYDARVRHLDSIGTTVREEVDPVIRLEAAKADKREGALVRTYESIAAGAARQYAEENAARVSELELVREEVETKLAVDEGKVERFLEEIRAIRRMLEDEREERQKADERILGTIVQTRKAWQRIALESLGDGS